MSVPIRPADPAPSRPARGGYTLIEVLVVLAIFALSTAIIMPSTARMLDQTTSHAVFFEFQRQVSDLRREANRTGEPVRIVDPSMPKTEGDRLLQLRAPWRYTLAPALDIAEGGGCSTVSANLINQDRVVMTLRADDGTCRFMRLQDVPKKGRGT
ncbi:type II secretion system protein [Brevundimonas sp.]|uniref:pilus assembly FimT family protein n=1 Tax=Brevundimonas sp. TaxID=1871086 RepID=UPI0028A2AD73|nr:type II secretion system protein [Brevundimonas sp.]